MTWGYVYEGKFIRQEIALKVATLNEEFLLNAKRAAQMKDGTIKEFPNLRIPPRRTRPISLDFKNAGSVAKELVAQLADDEQEELRDQARQETEKLTEAELLTKKNSD